MRYLLELFQSNTIPFICVPVLSKLSTSSPTLITFGCNSKPLFKCLRLFGLKLFGEVSYLGTEGHTAGSGDTEIKWKGINLIGTRIGFRYKF